MHAHTHTHQPVSPSITGHMTLHISQLSHCPPRFSSCLLKFTPPLYSRASFTGGIKTLNSLVCTMEVDHGQMCVCVCACVRVVLSYRVRYESDPVHCNGALWAHQTGLCMIGRMNSARLCSVSVDLSVITLFFCLFLLFFSFNSSPSLPTHGWTHSHIIRHHKRNVICRKSKWYFEVWCYSF